jgi:hypothetical protein
MMQGNPTGLNKIPKTHAENAFETKGCERLEIKRSNPMGQWWRYPGGGPKFFCQWSWPDTDFVDQQHFTRLLDDVERYAQVRKINAH